MNNVIEKNQISLEAKAIIIDKAFEELYPDVKCGLEHDGSSFKLLIMAILSAQCTDKRVNIVSKSLFKRFPDAKSIAESKPGELEQYIRSVGLYNSKAKSIRACCKTLCENFDGEIPSEMNNLLTLGGVGRKVANLIRGDVFNLGGIVADTHCIRISNRLGLCNSENPHSVEKQLSPLISADRQTVFCHRIVNFGRDICKAQNPSCDKCIFKERGLCSHKC